MKRLLVSVGLLGALALGGALGACDSKGGTGTNTPDSKILERGGLYVVYNHGLSLIHILAHERIDQQRKQMRGRQRQRDAREPAVQLDAARP